MSPNPVEDGLAVVGRFADPRLGLLASREELAAWVAEGDTLDPPLSPEDAIRRNLPIKHAGLVRDIALKYLHRGLDLDDLVGEANLGLTRAARHYDPGQLHAGRPVRFSTFATAAIHRQVRRGLYDRGRLIRVPEYLHKYLGSSPPIGPLTRLEAEHVDEARAATRIRSKSLAGRDGELDRFDLVDRREMPRGRGLDECEILLAALTERERQVVLARHGFDGPVPTYKEMVRGRGTTWQCVQQVERRAVRKMKSRARARHITYEGVFGEAS